MLTDDPEEGAESDGEEDEGPVPLVVVVDRGHAQEHEDDRLRAGAQHLQSVLQRRLGFRADVPLHVVLHRDAAERDAGFLGEKPNSMVN